MNIYIRFDVKTEIERIRSATPAIPATPPAKVAEVARIATLPQHNSHAHDATGDDYERDERAAIMEFEAGHKSKKTKNEFSNVVAIEGVHCEL